MDVKDLTKDGMICMSTRRPETESQLIVGTSFQMEGLLELLAWAEEQLRPKIEARDRRERPEG